MSRILLIEDDSQIRELLRETLEQEGHDVVACGNGFDGIKHFKQSKVDLVVLDVFLPDKDGFEMLTELKEHHENVNILAISGGFDQGTVNVLNIAERLGARRTLAKPFELKKFLNVVNQLLTAPQSPV